MNEDTIRKVLRCVGNTCQTIRNSYVEIQDDLPEGWTFSSTLNMIGLGAMVPGPKTVKKPVYDAEVAKQMFTELYVIRLRSLCRAKLVTGIANTLFPAQIHKQRSYYQHMTLLTPTSSSVSTSSL